MMPYEYAEDWAIADVAFIATEDSLEALFATAADALMNVMVEDLEAIAPAEEVAVRVEAESEDFLLVNFLQELIYHADAHGLLLRAPEVAIRRKNKLLRLEATARGERADPGKHAFNVEVKAVTYHRLRVGRNDAGKWEACVVLDI